MSVQDVKDVFIWGNHSKTQYPDIAVATVKGAPVSESKGAGGEILTEYWQGEFITKVQVRGAAVMEARKLSSAMSAANACKDHLRDWYFGSGGRTVSMGILAAQNPYEVKDGVCFSFPIVCGGNWAVDIKEGISLSDFSKQKIRETEAELFEEKELAALT